MERKTFQNGGQDHSHEASKLGVTLALGRSWPPRPTKSEGAPSFEALLGTVLASILEAFSVPFGMIFSSFSYLILKAEKSTKR